MKVVAIIPARGGSKRLPRKNLLPLVGKPLLAHTIEHAKKAESISRTIVSTEDHEVAAVADAYGADIIVRPNELASDTASSESALRHCLDHLKATEGYSPDLVVLLQGTSPIRRPSDIDAAVKILLDRRADSLLSACRSHVFLWRRAGDRVKSVNYDFLNRKRSQDIPEEFIENGSIYVFKPWVLDTLNNRLGGRIVIMEMDYWSSFQIDTPEEFALCEWILSRRGSPQQT